MSVRDVVVVGGGPAGSATALLLARAGFDVTLLDKQQFPRPKACGDCISPGANVLLQQLGVWDDVLAAKPAQLQGWALDCGSARFAAGFASQTSAGPLFSLALPREKLDQILMTHAQRAGVTVLTNARVHHLLRDNDAVVGVTYTDAEQQHSIKARLVVGADGLRSRVARELAAYSRAPRIKKLSLTAHLRGVKQLSQIGEMHVQENACLGLAPVESSSDPLCNVTVVLQRGGVDTRGRHQMMRNALTGFGRADIAELISDDETILGSGPFDWPVRQVISSGAALVGDAAGYFDPFTGQGIYHALAGAQQLSTHAQQALQGARSGVIRLTAYAHEQMAMKKAARRLQHIIDFICARTALSRFAFRAFASSPELARKLVLVTGDVLPVRALVSAASGTQMLRATLAAALS